MSFAAASLIFGLACFLALVLAPLIARAARRLSIVDQPDGNRKGQAEATPLGGGVAVLLAVVGAVTAALAMGLPTESDEATRVVTTGPLAIIGVVLLFVVGLIDDIRGLTGIYKLIGQVAAVLCLVAGGFRFETLGMFGMSLELGDFSIPFTAFFLLGAINAFNLIDGSDALASSVGAVVCLTLGVIAGGQGDLISSAICFALAGALTGFLSFNAPPACIYLGDTGSMMIGLIVAAVAVHCSIKRQAAFALAVPVAICAIPILDAVAALVRRITTGQSVFTADRGHLHHALLHRGWSAGKTAAFIAGLTAITCAGALISYFTHQDAYAVVAIVGVFATLAATRLFGHAEVKLLATHARSLVQGAYLRRTHSVAGLEKSVQIHGRRRWEMIWTALREAAPGHNLTALKLTVNIPRLHESFFASWSSNEQETPEEGWRLTLPLTLEGREVGKLFVEGRSSGSLALPEIHHLLEFLEPLEDQLRRLACDVAVAETGSRTSESAPPAQIAAEAAAFNQAGVGV